MQKIYILDTNVLINSPYAIFSFDEHLVCVTDVTIEELDKLKNAPGDTGANAREAMRQIEKLRMQGNLLEGVSLPSGGMFCILMSNIIDKFYPKDSRTTVTWDKMSPDNKILSICEAISINNHDRVVLVSNDTNMRIKASIIGLAVEEYRTEQAEPDDLQYKGRKEFLVPGKIIDMFYQTKFVPIENDILRAEDKLTLNEFVIMKDETNLSHGMIGKFNGKGIVPLQYADSNPYGITPRNAGQRFILEAMLAPVEEIPLVIVKGPAGSAKTFLSLACGLEKVLIQKEYEKILITRPNVKFDDDIGYVKGTEQDKISPLIRPIYDNLAELTRIETGEIPSLRKKKNKGYNESESAYRNEIESYGNTYMDELLERGIISAQAMAYMRGRSIPRTWILIDEAQNMTPTQAFGLISRAGIGSKVILIGDPHQIDNPKLDSRTNGLVFAAERMKGNPLCAQITMEDSECVRSPLAMAAIENLSPKGYWRKPQDKAVSDVPSITNVAENHDRDDEYNYLGQYEDDDFLEDDFDEEENANDISRRPYKDYSDEKYYNDCQPTRILKPLP